MKVTIEVQPNMTKAQECAALRAFNDALPADSYLRRWLDGVLPEVESNIKSDIFPWVTPKDTVAQCAKMVDEAEIMAAKKLQAAAQQADAKLANTEKLVAEAKRRMLEAAYSL